MQRWRKFKFFTRVVGTEDVSTLIDEWGVDWMHVAHDMDKWWALVNTVMNLQFT